MVKLKYSYVNTILLSYPETVLESRLMTVLREYPNSVTFIPDSPVLASNFKKIVDPIIRIAEEADLSFEILLPSVRGEQDSLKVSLERYDERISIYPVGSRNGALAFLTELSSTPYISFFSSTLPTDLWIADIISEYFARKENRLLLSDISIFPRSLLVTTGGMKNLGKYSIMEFYGRIAAIGWIISCTTNNRSLSFFEPGSPDSLFSSDLVQGDRISVRDLSLLKRSANLNNSDILAMVKDFRLRKKINTYFKTLLGRPPRPEPETGHFRDHAGYVQFMESILESIVFTDFLNYVPPEREIKLRIGKPELRLLEKRSKTWNRSRETVRKFLVLENS